MCLPAEGTAALGIGGWLLSSKEERPKSAPGSVPASPLGPVDLHHCSEALREATTTVVHSTLVPWDSS